MNTATRGQILNEVVCISHYTNTHGKSMNPTILFTVMGEIVGQAEIFNIVVATSLGERKLWIQTPLGLREGLVNIYI